MGAYLSTYAPYIPYARRRMLPGVYDIPLRIRVRAAYTNTVPVDAYRGAGRPEASYVIERLVDAAAREIGVAPDVTAAPEFHPAEGDAVHDADRQDLRHRRIRRQLSRAQELADWDGFNKRAAQRGAPELLRGIGIATYIEACGSNGPDTATLTLDRMVVSRCCRHADDGAGARHLLFADRRRSSRRCRPIACACCRATPRGSRPAPAPAGRVRFRPAACRSTAPPRNLPSS